MWHLGLEKSNLPEMLKQMVLQLKEKVRPS
jgi:hypothetical protein